jgi:glucokinase
MNRRKILSLDIGGTKTAVSVCDETGEVLAGSRIPTRPTTAIEIYFDSLERVCRDTIRSAGLETPAELDCIGISAPGPLSVEKGMLLAPPNNPGWIDIPIVEKMAELLSVPVYLNNDANAAALAEFHFGRYRGERNLIYLTTSTGMGGGVITGGKLLQGVCDMGGEVGHMVMELGGPLCPCGRRGCWELYVGGKNMADRVREKIRTDGIETRILAEAGGDLERIDHRCISRAARAGDIFALKEWDTYTDRLAQGIGSLIQAFNPARILLGTIAVREGEFLLDPLRNKLPRFTWDWPLRSCTVEASTLGDRIPELSGLAVALNRTGKLDL